MKIKNKYAVLGLIFSFISCDLLMNDEIKEKSLGLFNKVHSVLDAKVESIKDKQSNKKRRRVLKRKRPSIIGKKSFFNGNLDHNKISSDVIDVLDKDNLQQSNIIQKGVKGSLGRNDVVLKKENIQSQQDVKGNDNSSAEISTGFISNKYEEILNGNSIFLNGESGELKENVESNEINFTMDSDLRPKSDLQTISGSNDISYTEEIEEEDYDQYHLEKKYEEEYDEEEIRLSNRYNSYLEGVKYNVGSAIGAIDKIYNNYKLFEEQKTKMYSPRFYNVIKAQAKKEAEKFTKKELGQALENLLNYIQVSSKTATNFVYANEVYAKRRLDNIGSEVKTLIAKIKGQSNPYEAYKAIIGSILLMKDSLKVVQGAI